MGVSSDQTCKKTIFFTQTWFEPKIFDPKKCVNYDKSNSKRKNSLKGPKDPNGAQKIPKSNKCGRKCYKKRKIATILTSLKSEEKIINAFNQSVYPEPWDLMMLKPEYQNIQ